MTRLTEVDVVAMRLMGKAKKGHNGGHSHHGRALGGPGHESDHDVEETQQLKPMRAGAEDTEVVVKTEVRGKGDPIQLDYRLEKSATGWKIYDVNVLGVWLVENYRNSFAQEISANGIDGLIAKLAERNKAAKG